MAGGSSVPGARAGGRRSLDAEVNMVPMIDLMVACIAFLLMTAVWTQTGALHAQQPVHHASDEPVPVPVQERLKITVSPDSLRVGVNAADVQSITGPDQLGQLRRVLAARRVNDPIARAVSVSPDSSVPFDQVALVMDAVYDVWSRGQPPGNPRAAAVDLQLM